MNKRTEIVALRCEVAVSSRETGRNTAQSASVLQLYAGTSEVPRSLLYTGTSEVPTSVLYTGTSGVPTSVL